jgi:hypothetical protein
MSLLSCESDIKHHNPDVREYPSTIESESYSDPIKRQYFFLAQMTQKVIFFVISKSML